jgi:hypothetical protein
VHERLRMFSTEGSELAAVKDYVSIREQGDFMEIFLVFRVH